MTRLALLLSHDDVSGQPALIGRLADALVPFFDEVRWAIASRASDGTAASTGSVRPTRLRLPRFPATGAPLLDWLTSPAVDLCAGWPRAALDHGLGEASLVVVESGPLAASMDRFRRSARKAELVYFATRRLAPKAVHPRVGRRLQRDAILVDRAVTTARTLLPDLAMFGARARFVPAGVEAAHDAGAGATLDAGSTAVVLDAGHFDASVLQIAATTLPGTRFHLLGGRADRHRFPANVEHHGDPSPALASRLMDRADLGLVPDASDPPATPSVCAAVDRLYGHGIPIVCPAGLADHDPHLFGYDTGRSASVRAALRLAVQARRKPRTSLPSAWQDVARCVIGTEAGADRDTTADGPRHAG